MLLLLKNAILIGRIFKRSISIHVDCGSSMELVEMENQPQHKELVTSEETTLMPEALETGKPESCSKPITLNQILKVFVYF